MCQSAIKYIPNVGMAAANVAMAAPNYDIDLRPYGLDWTLKTADPFEIPEKKMVKVIRSGNTLNFMFKKVLKINLTAELGKSGTYGVIWTTDAQMEPGVEMVVKVIDKRGGITEAELIMEALIQIIVCKETATKSVPEIGLVGPFAPKFYLMGKSQSEYYIVIERMTATVKDDLEANRYKPSILTQHLCQIAKISSILSQDLQFNHRDFKPDNVMYKTIGGQKHVRYIDFGFSCLNYHGLDINIDNYHVKHCNLLSRDMTMIINYIANYSGYSKCDIQDLLYTLIDYYPQRPDGWAAAYPFYNTSPNNPNTMPDVVFNIFSNLLYTRDTQNTTIDPRWAQHLVVLTPTMVPNMKSAALLLIPEPVLHDFLQIKPRMPEQIRLFFTLVNANNTSLTDQLLSVDSSYLMDKDPHGSTIYHAMCVLKNAVGLDYIMSKNQAPMLINDRDGTGKTPLQIAIINNWSPGVRKLMTTPGINIKSRDNNSRNALFFAVETKSTPFVKILLSTHKGLDFVNNSSDIQQDSALSLAVRTGQVNIINALISIPNIDVNMGPPAEPNLLFIIAKGHLPSDLQTTLFNLTVASVQLIDLINNLDQTPLMIAASNDNIDFVNLWIALPDRLTAAQDRNGDTALHHAMRLKQRSPEQLRKQELVVRALLEANPALSTIRNRQGRLFGLMSGLRASSKLIAGTSPLRELIKTRAANRKQPIVNTNLAIKSARQTRRRR